MKWKYSSNKNMVSLNPQLVSVRSPYEEQYKRLTNILGTIECRDEQASSTRLIRLQIVRKTDS